MNSQGSNELPPDWQWKLEIERRLIWLEIKVVDLLGKRTMDRGERSLRWEARDYMMAGSGIAMVIAAMTQKIGWTAVGAFLIRLYGGR